MIYTEMTRRAMQIAFEAHRDQTDKGGTPYIFHPMHLAEQMDDEDSTCVALLHDTVEDSAITIEYLREQGFSERILEAVFLLTHAENEPYFEYVQRLKANPIARKVKLADLRHNSDESRLREPTAKDRERWRKYREAIAILTEV